MKSIKVDISYKTILFIVAVVAAIGILSELKTLLIMFVVAFILAEALHPIVIRLERYHVPRILAGILVYVLIFGVFSSAIVSAIPIMIEQSRSLAQIIPEYLRTVKIFGSSPIDLSSQFKLLEALPSGIAKATFSLFSNLLSTLFVLVISLYLLMTRKDLSQKSFSALGAKRAKLVMDVLIQLERRLGGWLIGQGALMLIVGVLSYIGYLLLGIDYAISLAILAGMLEMVPNLGPFIASTFAALVGFTTSPMLGLLAFCWGVIVQQLENHVIVPKVMKEATGINPLVTLLLVAAGAQIGGILGAILAIPLYLTLDSIYDSISRFQKEPK